MSDLEDTIYRLKVALCDARDENSKLEQQLYEKDDIIDDLKRQVKEFERERNRAYDCYVLNGEREIKEGVE